MSASGAVTRPSRAFSLALAIVGGSLWMLLGIKRYTIDGSFWIDEASVAQSLMDLSTVELLGQLKYQISFPRLYLLAIKGVGALFGFETAVLRLLPQLFFLAATFLWVRLFYLRFRAIPLLIGFAIALNFFPTTWFVYSSMLKQYSFETFCALMLFSISDESLEGLMRRGEKLWLAPLLALPCAFAYSYFFALAGRGLGWYLGGLAKGKRSLEPRALLGLLVTLVLCTVSLYFSDVRHTLGVASLDSFWRTCFLTSEGVAPLALLDELFFGWYDGRTLYNDSPGLNAPMMVVLRGFFLIGLVRVVTWLFVPRRVTEEHWETRSIGALCCLVTLILGSLVIDYPLCASRLVLFALFAMQMIILEGVAALRELLLRAPSGSRIANLGLIILLAGTLPDAKHEYLLHLDSNPPQNLRPLLERIHRQPLRPLLVDACTIRQIRTLPEGVGDLELIYYLRRMEFGSVWDHIPYGEDAWVLNAQPTCPPFGDPAKSARSLAIRWTPLHMPRDTAKLYGVRFQPERPKPRKPKKR